MKETSHLMVVDLGTRRLASEITAKPERPPDHHFRLRIEAEHFSDGHVQVEWGEIITAVEIPTFHKLCLDSRGKTREEWFQLINELQIHHISANQVQQLESTAWYLIKASLLTYLWTEVAVLNGDPVHLRRHLTNEFVLDYTGKEGPQRYIYFLPAQLIQETNNAYLQRMYAMCLLSRLTVALDDQAVQTYFTPIHYPSQGVFAFDDAMPQGGPCYRLWRTIIERMSARLRTFAEGQTKA